MGKFDEAFSRGDVMRRVQENERNIELAMGGRRLHSSSIDAGSLTVKGEGSIRSTNWDGDPANVTAEPGTEGWALGAAGLVVNDGVLRGEVRSANFVKGKSGFRLLPNGDAELNDAILRGDIASSNFDGDLDADDPGTTGWAMDDSGKAAFNTLLLGDRIIGPDSLGITWDGAGESATNFGLSTTKSAKVSDTLVVPEWATEALVMCWVNASVENTSANGDTAFLQADIDGTGGGEQYTWIEPTDWSNLGASAQRVLSGGSLGTSISVEARMRTANFTWSAAAGNIANVTPWRSSGPDTG